MLKTCPKCSFEKSISEFYQRKKHRAGEYYEKCKDCMKSRGRSYYQNNKERQLPLALARKKRYKEERRKWLEKIKNKPCTDCGKIYPAWVMDFDHRDGVVKIRSISWMALHDTSNFEKIKQEIKKCDLVCANCHRQRTHDKLVKIATVAKMVKAGV